MSPLWGDSKKETPKELNRPEEIRKMGGHDGDIAAAIASAPESSDDIPIASSVSPSRKKKGRPISPQPAIPIVPQISAEEAKRQADIAAARKKIGESMMKDLAGMPYDIWAFVASDDSLSLTKDEEKELADAYYLVAQSFNFSSSPTWTAVLFLISHNARLVKSRVKSLKELEQTIKEIKESK